MTDRGAASALVADDTIPSATTMVRTRNARWIGFIAITSHPQLSCQSHGARVHKDNARNLRNSCFQACSVCRPLGTRAEVSAVQGWYASRLVGHRSVGAPRGVRGDH